MPKVRIRMERPFDEFLTEDKRDFFECLSQLTGASMLDLRFGVFRPGCVIYEVNLTSEEKSKLLEHVLHRGVSDAAASEDDPYEVKLYATFVKSHRISEIRDLDYDKPVHTSKSSEGPPAVIFIHGWSSDRCAFGDLPERLEEETGLTTLQPGYPTGKIGDFPGLVSIAQHLDNQIAIGSSKCRNLALIGHSMGGVLARRLLVGAPVRTALVDKNVRQLTLIASPSSGSALASVANFLPFFTQIQIADLAKGSTFMQDLTPRWVSWMHDNARHNCRVRAIYGEKDKVVPKADAMLFDSCPVPVLDGNHSTVVNPENDDARDLLLNTIVNFLVEAGLS